MAAPIWLRDLEMHQEQSTIVILRVNFILWINNCYTAR